MAEKQSDKIQKNNNLIRIIDEILYYTGLNAAQFLKKTGINSNAISGIKKGLSKSLTDSTIRKIRKVYPEISPEFLRNGTPPMLLTEYSGNIHHNQAGGDIIGNGSVKSTETAELDKLISAVATLTETNKQQTEQIGELIRFITSK